MEPYSPPPTFLTNKRSRAHFAKVLRGQKHALLMFYSKRCALCQTMRPVVEEVSQREHKWLEVCRICADDQNDWVPEMLHYGIEYVPCFVMLLPGGESDG